MVLHRCCVTFLYDLCIWYGLFTGLRLYYRYWQSDNNITPRGKTFIEFFVDLFSNFNIISAMHSFWNCFFQNSAFLDFCGYLNIDCPQIVNLWPGIVLLNTSAIFCWFSTPPPLVSSMQYFKCSISNLSSSSIGCWHNMWHYIHERSLKWVQDSRLADCRLAGNAQGGL